MEKLGLDDNENDDYPYQLEKFKEQIEYIVEYYGDMTVAFGEFVAAGGEGCWQPFMSHYRRMLNGEGSENHDISEEGEDESADEEYQKILASLRKLKIRSWLMRRLIKAKSDSQSPVA
ncbi:hypothetical protein MKX03_032454 [Papaver bracteatum]|nr:hypothetical protein MKX03_032454 [Papaver bracteatum]